MDKEKNTSNIIQAVFEFVGGELIKVHVIYKPGTVDGYLDRTLYTARDLEEINRIIEVVKHGFVKITPPKYYDEGRGDIITMVYYGEIV